VKLERVSLSKRLYEQLKKDIVECRIEFGEKLINRELQQKYGVSSTPVRDAINHLYLDGLVENISNTGAKVVTFDLQFVLEVNEMLTLLCNAAVECSAVRADRDEVCAQLEKALLKQQSAVLEEYYRCDFLFHKVFFDHCKNTQYQKNYSRYHVLFEMLARRFHGFQEDNRKSSIKQHQEILESYRAGDIALAAQQMRAHFAHAERLFRQYMD